jgi:hypothetical protein
MPSHPDLSWMDDVVMDVERELANAPSEIRRSPEFAQAILGSKRLRELWARARLTDGNGGDFDLKFERLAPAHGLRGSDGAATCSCPPPVEGSELTLHFGGADIAIPLTPVRRRPAQAQESTFRGGYAGPKEPIPFHEGAIKLISTLVYEDRIRMEWLADPPPDLSWLFNDALTEYIRPQLADEEQRLLEARWSQNFKRTFALWMGARLTDNLHTPYLGSVGNSGVASTGFKGEVNFIPSAPPDARELHLTLYDLSIFVSLESR